MPRYLVGIDTGGTYTDTVILDADRDAVMASAKSLTTYGDLSRGVSSSLHKALKAVPLVEPKYIEQVSLSTTLATNALVEGRGSSIVVVLIGFDAAMVDRTRISSAIPAAQIVSINGGHRFDGHEQTPLDEDALREACRNHPADAYAVASHYAVRNPIHERRAVTLIRNMTGKPVSASCDLSDSLNGPLRALTAAFNARIISLLVDLKTAVSASLSSLGIEAPVMMVKGDGSIASADTVIEKPIETILSGPAASVIGARYLTRLRDFVVADIGGTTSDVATVTNGWPKLNVRGANIGGYHTLVKAIDMRTIGLGGDSAVDLDETSTLQVLHNRVVPISMLAALYPVVENELESALGQTSGMRSALNYLIPGNSRDHDTEGLISAKEQHFLATLYSDCPTRYDEVVNRAADRACVKALLDRGILRQSGVTPSDAAHVLGLQNQWSARAARAAIELLGRASHRVSGADSLAQVEALSQEIIDLVVSNSARLLVTELSGLSDTEKNPLIDSIATGNTHLGNLHIMAKSELPLVAVGGPATVFYPTVGQRIRADTRIPDHSSVANAIGAAVGMIRAERTVEITLSESGGYLIHGDDEPEFSDNATQALTRAHELAGLLVKTEVRNKGGRSSDVDFVVQRIQIPDVDDDTGLISARIIASCDSLPG